MDTDSWTCVNFFVCALLILGNLNWTQAQDCHQRLDNVGNRKCHKSCSSDRDCRGRNQCLCDGECGLSCINRNLRCHPTPSIGHGRVDINPYNQFAAIAKYTCDEGYTIRGLSARICQGDGTWKGDAPRCEQNHLSLDKNQNCGPPPQKPHARHDAPKGTVRFKLGTNLRYRCEDNFFPQKGSIDRAWCVRGPKWVGPHITCMTSSCPNPPNLENGYVDMSKNMVGGKVQYTCKVGYYLVGHKNRTCQEDGTWDKTEPSCESVVCGPPPVVEHAEHDGPKEQYRFLAGSQLNYTCQHGYYREGTKRAICQGTSGKWLGPIMKCAARDCGTPGEISNGWRDQGYRFTYPTRVTYYCNEGYELRGGHYRECMANGEWSMSVPKCQPLHCDELGPPLHGTRIGSRTAYGSVIRFVCNNGYKVVGSAERSCQADRTWSGQDAFCEEINCGLPGPIWNGYLDGHRTTVGAVYFYRCNLRTKFNGTAFATQCLENGQWSNPIPKCLGQCRVPSIHNGTINQPREGVFVDHGTVIEPRCLNGLVLNDSRPVTCFNGTWTVTPRCIPAPCNSSPPQLQNGHRVFFSLSHGAQARYFCFAGYRLVDKVQYLKCEFGKWIGTRPMCEEHFCPHPGNLKNGQILKVGVKGLFPFSDYIYTIRHGERLVYECDRDHRLVGPRGAACVNGKWSPREQPKCMRSRHPVFSKLWRPFEENHRHPQYY